MGANASEITSLTVFYSTGYSGADRRKHQSSASLAFVRGIHRWPVNSPHKWPVRWKTFSFDDVIILSEIFKQNFNNAATFYNTRRVGMAIKNDFRPFMTSYVILAQFKAFRSEHQWLPFNWFNLTSDQAVALSLSCNTALLIYASASISICIVLSNGLFSDRIKVKTWTTHYLEQC